MFHVKHDLTLDRERALTLTPVSRETLQRVDCFVELLLRWQSKINLISASTIPHVWTRHIADSLQLIDLARDDRPGATIHLVESNMKKAAFLREAVQACSAPASVHGMRIESFAKGFRGPLDAVTARAVSPLNTLLNMCFPLLAKNGVTGLFPKGQNVALELDEAAKSWKMKAELVPSRTDPAGRIVVVRGLERAS